MKKKSLIDPNSMNGAISINLIAGTILIITQQVLPAEVWIFLIILLIINYCILYYFQKPRIKYTILFTINITLLVFMIFLIINKPFSFPITSNYWIWKQTDTIFGNDSSLLPVKIINNNTIELNIDRPERIAERELYYNIGYIHKVSDLYWLLEVRYSNRFVDFSKGNLMVDLDKKYFPKNEEIVVYLTNKPKMNMWVRINNYSRPFYREIGLINNGGL